MTDPINPPAIVAEVQVESMTLDQLAAYCQQTWTRSKKEMWNLGRAFSLAYNKKRAGGGSVAFSTLPPAHHEKSPAQQSRALRQRTRAAQQPHCCASQPITLSKSSWEGAT